MARERIQRSKRDFCERFTTVESKTLGTLGERILHWRFVVEVPTDELPCLRIVSFQGGHQLPGDVDSERCFATLHSPPQGPSEGPCGQKTTLVAHIDDSANFQSVIALLTEDKVERSDCETATASGLVTVICAEDHLSGGIRNFNEDRCGVSTNRVVPR